MPDSSPRALHPSFSLHKSLKAPYRYVPPTLSFMQLFPFSHLIGAKCDLVLLSCVFSITDDFKDLLCIQIQPLLVSSLIFYWRCYLCCCL